MKCAVVLAEGVKQIMFTPENESEKRALAMISVNDDISVERKTGHFCDGDRVAGYSVSMCQGGFLRAFDDSDSLMLVLRDKKGESDG